MCTKVYFFRGSATGRMSRYHFQLEGDAPWTDTVVLTACVQGVAPLTAARTCIVIYSGAREGASRGVGGAHGARKVGQSQAHNLTVVGELVADLARQRST